MQLLQLNEVPASRNYIETFGGYNHNIRIPESDFYDMTNLTSDAFPVMSPRAKRCVESTYGDDINGIISKDAPVTVRGTKVYVNNVEVTGLTVTNGKKQLIGMGAYVIIMPDKKYVNTAKLTDYGNIDAAYVTTGTVTYTMCNADGEDYTGVFVSASEPSDPTNKMLWIDTSEEKHVLKQFSMTTSVWVSIQTTYVKIKHPNIASSFKQWDGVKISGIDPTITQLADLEGKTSVLYNAYHDPGDASVPRAEGVNDYLVVVGILDTEAQQAGALSVSRTMPLMDFVIESNNRLWGCRYGTNNDGEVVNEIYASKLGDFKNWFVYLGLSTDSYAASCGTDGQWTGAISHMGYPCFFKENVLHKVYGNVPANFQIQTTPCRGVQKGAGESLAIVNEILFYKSREGVCAYDGSLPTSISKQFGNIKYTGLDTGTGYDPLRCGAVAGGHRNKYYISMLSEVDNTWNLFVYDASAGLWHREDNTRVRMFASLDDYMYFVSEAEKTKLIGMGKTGGTMEGPVEWSADTGILGLSVADQKRITKLLIRMQMELNMTVRFYVEYDSSGDWEHIASITGTTLRTFTLPLKPKRCDHFRLRIEGQGDAKIISITKTLEQGSDKAK